MDFKKNIVTILENKYNSVQGPKLEIEVKEELGH